MSTPRPLRQVGGSLVNKPTAVFCRGASFWGKTQMLQHPAFTTVPPNPSQKLQFQGPAGIQIVMKLRKHQSFRVLDKTHEIKCLILIIYLVWFKRIKI